MQCMKGIFMNLFNLDMDEEISFDSPINLFDSYKNKTITSLYDYQSDVINKFMDKIDKKDVLIELPTGSGKSLVGILIADFLRKEKKLKVLYLCLTNQLVEQTYELAISKYGISANKFIGSKKSYSLHDKNCYEDREGIAITSYSAFFNSNPYFQDPDVIIFDDAHSAKSYVDGNWSVNIDREEHSDLYNRLLDISRPHINSETYETCVERSSRFKDADKIPNILFIQIIKVFKETIDLYIEENKDKNIDFLFAWELIKNKLLACNVFLSENQFLIKPLVAPTKFFKPFENAKQRIYMSATSGISGELNRIFGVESIVKVTNDKFQNNTIGRRFFLFPSLFINDSELGLDFIKQLMDLDKRSLLLVENNKVEKQYTEYWRNLKKIVYSGRDLELDKSKFIVDENAIAIISNRTDGLNFPDDECRILFLDGLQENTDLQEFFISYRMLADVLFLESKKIKFIQAIGRCTRSYTDYAVICILDDNLSRFVLQPNILCDFVPELRAELEFSNHQRKNNSENCASAMIEMVKSFLAKNDDWKKADHFIQTLSEKYKKEKTTVFQTNKILEEVSKYEINFSNALWKNDWCLAITESEEAIELLKTETQMNGYLAFWYYLSAYAEYLRCDSNDLYIIKLKKAAQYSKTVNWFNKIPQAQVQANKFDVLLPQIHKIKAKIEDNLLKNNNDKTILINELKNMKNKFIELMNIDDSKRGTEFEDFLVQFGTWLGHDVYNFRSTGAPDPILTIDRMNCIVTECKIKNENQKIKLKDFRQINTHNDYVKNNSYDLELFSECNVYKVFISNVDIIQDYDTKNQISDDCYYVNSNDILCLYDKMLPVLLSIVKEYDFSKQAEWINSVYELLVEFPITSKEILSFCQKRKLKDLSIN